MSQDYKVIARKWRPEKFSELVGQNHIGQTLRNAVKNNRTAHAYLFVGPRGTGKTTSARIFAKAINCTNPQNGEPCCECDSCVSISEGSNMDVIEIDAASQNSVGNARELCENVRFTPVKSKYKIYIIDEVHMLSASAWNALLKTIEEPPPHVKFLFATTEVHKVLGTIISRCQRFDLRPIPSKLIAKRLSFIAEKEDVQISKGAIDAISRAADGGMRDGQSLLDQMISFYGNEKCEIEEKQVLALFGLTALDEMTNLVYAILSNCPGEVVENIHKLALDGKNLEKLFNEITATFRGIEITLLSGHASEILDANHERMQLYKNFASETKLSTIRILLEQTASNTYIISNAVNKQITIESIILKAMRTAHSVKVDDILNRLNQLRNKGELEFLEKIPDENLEKTKKSIPTEKKLPKQANTHSEEKKFKKKNNSANLAENIRSDQKEKSVEQVSKEDNSAKLAENIRSDQKEKSSNTNSKENSPEKKPESEYPKSRKTDKTKSLEESYDKYELWDKLKIEVEKLGDNILKSFMDEAFPNQINENSLKIIYSGEYEKSHFEKLNERKNFLEKILKRITYNSNASLVLIQKENSTELQKKELQSKYRKDKLEKSKKNESVSKIIDLFDGDVVDIAPTDD